MSDHDRALPALLEPLRFVLRGSTLVEASAGTGKTFTIAALYVRLVLGHGGPAAFDRPLAPPEVLVVTFTDAATKELRDRIRARLAQAARAFSSDAPVQDDFLRALRDEYPPAEWPACAERLRVAAEWMDEAAVSTIHGWCRRMLREHAFDSGSPLSLDLEPDTRAVLDETVRDYWRTHFYPLGAEDAARVAAWWPTPAALAKALRNLLRHAEGFDDGTPCAQLLADGRRRGEAQLQALRSRLAPHCDAFKDWLDDLHASRRVAGLRPADYTRWIAHLKRWCEGQEAQWLPTDTARSKLSAAGLAALWREGTPQVHPAQQELDALAAQVAALPDGREAVLAHAACWVARRFRQEQEQRAQVSFDDLLLRLHAAVTTHPALAERIRRQFPVALIDEFQDTDPIQYGIFKAVYAPASPEPATALVLIGDPKQAIYGFRGADIHTYLEARRTVEGLATLGTNFRSTGGMVDAVNTLFGQAEERTGGEGAFLFRSESGNPMPFLRVAARGRDEAWVVEDGNAGLAPAPALTLWWHEEARPLKAGRHREAMGERCATEIVRLLRLGQAGRAGFRQSDGSLLPVVPAHMAVLVDNRDQADAVREALSVRGVRSVYLSEQENVYGSPAAGQLEPLLRACAAPEDGALVRAALASALLGLDGTALDRLNVDEAHWDDMLETFRSLRDCWRRQGVLPMLHRLLHRFDVPARLIAAGDERRLTDLLHLAELLQEASASAQGEHALVRHLAQQRRDSAHPSTDERQMRLESDAGLLKVVTVHKSKGLEYPLVFLPFTAACRPVDAQDVGVTYHGPDGTRRVRVKAEAHELPLADRERLGEDTRKLYVALTRARFATWVGVALTEALPDTAIHALLGRADEALPQRLSAAVQRCDAAVVARAPEPTPDRFVPVHQERPLAAPPALPRERPERWWIASYSRLRRAGEDAQARQAPVSAQEETWLELADRDTPDPANAAEADPASPATLHGFPRGPVPGNFLHAMLEWAARQGFAQALAEPGLLDGQLAQVCRPARWTPYRQTLQDWMTRWLSAPWDLGRLGATTAVAPVALQRIQPEMEFWVGAREVDAAALDRAVRAHTLGQASRPLLEPERLNGMLKGFIDLVFEHEGRWWVADYKSNWLGPTDAHYTPGRMRQEVLLHRYELQYSLYLFALHRLLRSRLPHYDYDRHVGGAVYLFLRGHAAPGGGLHLERPPAALMHALDALFDGQAAKEAA